MNDQSPMTNITRVHPSAGATTNIRSNASAPTAPWPLLIGHSLSLGHWSLVILLFIVGCHTAPPLNTPSGRPEVLIQGKTAQQILNASQDFFIRRGYLPKASDNGYKLVFDRRTEKPGATPSKRHCWRVRLTLVDLGGGFYRLIGLPSKVDGCGGELESESLMPQSFSQIQAIIEQIKAQLN